MNFKFNFGNNNNNNNNIIHIYIIHSLYIKKANEKSLQ